MHVENGAIKFNKKELAKLKSRNPTLDQLAGALSRSEQLHKAGYYIHKPHGVYLFSEVPDVGTECYGCVIMFILDGTVGAMNALYRCCSGWHCSRLFGDESCMGITWKEVLGIEV